MFKIWLGNLGKYNEGFLVGEWVDLPCDDFGAVFDRIGINEEYEEFFIADHDNDYGYCVGEYDNLDMLNEVAETLEGLDDDGADIYRALHDDGWNHDEIIEILEDGNYIVYPNCDSMGDVAYQAFEDSGHLNEIEKVIDPIYIDWDSLGRDMDFEGSFHEFAKGYVQVF